MDFVLPSSWEHFLHLFSSAAFVKLKHTKNIYDGIQVARETIPLEFEENKGENYLLSVKGLSRITVMSVYDYVLFEGKLYKLQTLDCKRLLELKKMLDHSSKGCLQISLKQV